MCKSFSVSSRSSTNDRRSGRHGHGRSSSSSSSRRKRRRRRSSSSSTTTIIITMRRGGEGGGDLDSDEAKSRGKRTKEQEQAMNNKTRNNTFQSDTPAGRRIFGIVFPRVLVYSTTLFLNKCFRCIARPGSSKRIRPNAVRQRWNTGRSYPAD